MASLRLVIALLSAALVLAASPSAYAIVDGELDTEHDYVVLLRVQVQPAAAPGVWVTSTGYVCSGVLASPTVVVTAGHCSLFARPPFPITAVRFVAVTGESALTAPTGSATGRFVTHPGFNPAAGPSLGNVDLGVVLLDTPLEGPYVNLPKEGWVGKHFEKSKQLVVVGYGATAPGARATTGTRRFVQSRGEVAAGGEYFLELPTPEKEKYGTACQGDSGGANVVGNTLVGVTSFGNIATCNGPNYVFRVDTPVARAFLDDYVELR